MDKTPYLLGHKLLCAVFNYFIFLSILGLLILREIRHYAFYELYYL